MNSIVLALIATTAAAFIQYESVVTNTFKGAKAGNLFILQNGEAYVQTSGHFHFYFAVHPTVVVSGNNLTFPDLGLTVQAMPTVCNQLFIERYSRGRYGRDTLFFSGGSIGIGGYLGTFNHAVYVYRDHLSRWKITNVSDLEPADIEIY